VAGLAHLAQERTDLSEADVDHLHSLVGSWGLLADLALSDLVLWLPTWNEAGYVAAALVRPATAATAVPQDIVGVFIPRGQRPELDRACSLGRPVTSHVTPQDIPTAPEAFPVRREGKVIGIVTREVIANRAPRVTGSVEEVYLAAAEDLFNMVCDGEFPYAGATATASSAPRVGDGFIRLDADGKVSYASPNAQSVFRRLGLATDLVGVSLAVTGTRLSHRPGPVDESIGLVLGGRAAGSVELENASGSMTAVGFPLKRQRHDSGAMVLVRDVTELRRRDRALLTKEASIREIHHRVKNNLQTVAALLRLQARRVTAPEAQLALAEAVRRVASVAVVHDMLAHEPGDTVSFDEVVARVIGLVRELAPAHAGDGPAAQIVCEGEVGNLPVELAAPLAMALSEVVDNALEHARASRVVLNCARTTDEVVVTITDDGSGVASAITPGLGLQIVQTLVTDELKGSVEIGDAPGGSGVLVKLRVPA
jgi:hypothetical protein